MIYRKGNLATRDAAPFKEGGTHWQVGLFSNGT